MYFEEETNKGTFQFLSGLAIGALLGAGIALMVAPQSGKRTRRKMIKQVVQRLGIHSPLWIAARRICREKKRLFAPFSTAPARVACRLST